MKMRVATTEDVEALFEIRTNVKENHESREELVSVGITPATVAKMLAEDSHAWIIEADGELVAFLMAKGPERTIFAIFARPEYEGRGFGWKLMEAEEQWLWSPGVGEIWITTGGEGWLRAHGFIGT